MCFWLKEILENQTHNKVAVLIAEHRMDCMHITYLKLCNNDRKLDLLRQQTAFDCLKRREPIPEPRQTWQEV